MPDRELPESDLRFIASAQKVYDCLVDCSTAYVHCRAGIGRAALFASTLLVLAGVLPDDALGVIEHARGVGVPDTDEQIVGVQNVCELCKRIRSTFVDRGYVDGYDEEVGEDETRRQIFAGIFSG